MGGNLKRRSSEKIREGPAINVVDTTLILIPKVANGGNQWHTKNAKKVL